jgi:hypothetical protein
MKNLQNFARPRALSCVWIQTGNSRQPLACRWIEDKIPFPEWDQNSNAPDRLQLERGRRCA